MPKLRLFPQKPVSEMDVLRREIKPGARVVCVGCYDSPRDDPSGLFLAHEMKARVTAIDMQAGMHGSGIALTRLIRTRGVHISRGEPTPESVERNIRVLDYGTSATHPGIGGLLNYAQGVRELQDAGMIKPVRMRYRFGTAWETGTKPGETDAFVDRGTHLYVMDQGIEKLRNSVAHYIDTLPTGGKTVFFTEAKEAEALRRILREFRGVVSVRERPVTSAREKDEYIINGKGFKADRDYDLAIVMKKMRNTKKGRK